MDKKIYSVDFDGTLASEAYPEIGTPIWKIIYYVKTKQSEGHTIILNTCREGKYLEDAVAFCHEHGLEFDYVNENAKERIEMFGTDCRKISADYYIDDKALTLTDIGRELREIELE